MNGRPPGGRFDRRRPEQGLRINHRIRVPEVRVITEEEQLGILPTHEALRLAEERGLDLVEISPRAFPPVCKITVDEPSGSFCHAMPTSCVAFLKVVW